MGGAAGIDVITIPMRLRDRHQPVGHQKRLQLFAASIRIIRHLRAGSLLGAELFIWRIAFESAQHRIQPGVTTPFVLHLPDVARVVMSCQRAVIRQYPDRIVRAARAEVAYRALVQRGLRLVARGHFNASRFDTALSYAAFAAGTAAFGLSAPSACAAGATTQAVNVATAASAAAHLPLVISAPFTPVRGDPGTVRFLHCRRRGHASRGGGHATHGEHHGPPRNFVPRPSLGTTRPMPTRKALPEPLDRLPWALSVASARLTRHTRRCPR